MYYVDRGDGRLWRDMIKRDSIREKRHMCIDVVVMSSFLLHFLVAGFVFVCLRGINVDRINGSRWYTRRYSSSPPMAI